MSKIVIAVPRGRITKECKNLLLKTSFAPDPLLFDKDTRKLTFKSKKSDGRSAIHDGRLEICGYRIRS